MRSLSSSHALASSFWKRSTKLHPCMAVSNTWVPRTHQAQVDGGNIDKHSVALQDSSLSAGHKMVAVMLTCAPA